MEFCGGRGAGGKHFSLWKPCFIDFTLGQFIKWIIMSEYNKGTSG